MSVKVMGVVWESDLPQREKFVLLAYADHADHMGNNVFPSVGLIAWKTGYTTRSIQRITKTLLDKGILIDEGKSKYGTNKYKIDAELLPKLPQYGRGDRLSPGIYGGDILSGDKQGGGDKSSQRGDILAQGGDIAGSPEPSLIKPSVKEPSVKDKAQSKKRSRDPLLDQPAILAYKEEARLNIQIGWREEVADTVKDVDRWRAIIHEWIGRGWNKQNVKGMLDAYRNGSTGDSRASPRNTTLDAIEQVEAEMERERRLESD